MALKGGLVQPSAVCKQPIMHLPVPALITGAPRRNGGIHARPLEGSWKVPIEEPDFSRLDIFVTESRPGFLKKFDAKPASEIGIFDERDRRLEIAPRPPIIPSQEIGGLSIPPQQGHQEHEPDDHCYPDEVPHDLSLS